jgi:hypothetical protein
MLTLDHFHKQVRFYTSITQGALPTSVFAYVENNNFKWTQLHLRDFKDYQFVGYRYEHSYYPNVERITP